MAPPGQVEQSIRKSIVSVSNVAGTEAIHSEKPAHGQDVHTSSVNEALQISATDSSSQQVLIRRLRERNRHLEEELVTLAMRREEHYQAQAEETQARCQQILEEKQLEQEQWYEAKRREVIELKAAFTIAFNIYMLRKQALHRQITQNEAVFKQQLQENTEEAERLRKKLTAELVERTKVFDEKVADYEQQLDKLTRQSDSQAVHIRHLEMQLASERRQRQTLISRHEHELLEANGRKDDHRGDESPQIADGHVQRHAKAIRALQRKALAEKQSLEHEILEYVRYILNSHEYRASSYLDRMDYSEVLLWEKGIGIKEPPQLPRDAEVLNALELIRPSSAGHQPGRRPGSARHRRRPP